MSLKSKIPGTGQLTGTATQFPMLSSTQGPMKQARKSTDTGGTKTAAVFGTTAFMTSTSIVAQNTYGAGNQAMAS